MVLPQDRLTTKLSHIGMINGKKIIKVETFNQNGSKVRFLVIFWRMLLHDICLFSNSLTLLSNYFTVGC